MKFLYLQRLIFNPHVDRPVILQLDVLDVGRELIDVTGNGEIAGPRHGSTNVDAAGDRRMPGDLALKVSPDQRVKVEPQKLDGNLAGPISTKTHVSVNV